MQNQASINCSLFIHMVTRIYQCKIIAFIWTLYKSRPNFKVDLIKIQKFPVQPNSHATRGDVIEMISNEPSNHTIYHQSRPLSVTQIQIYVQAKCDDISTSPQSLHSYAMDTLRPAYPQYTALFCRHVHLSGSASAHPVLSCIQSHT